MVYTRLQVAHDVVADGQLAPHHRLQVLLDLKQAGPQAAQAGHHVADLWFDGVGWGVGGGLRHLGGLAWLAAQPGGALAGTRPAASSPPSTDINHSVPTHLAGQRGNGCVLDVAQQVLHPDLLRLCGPHLGGQVDKHLAAQRWAEGERDASHRA